MAGSSHGQLGNLRIFWLDERIIGIGWKNVQEALKGTSRLAFQPEGLHRSLEEKSRPSIPTRIASSDA
jgi:hypothetical protein